MGIKTLANPRMIALALFLSAIAGPALAEDVVVRTEEDPTNA